jgi:CHAT domain-containing protein/tetratricopeptide (TPR) repeat protein
MLLAASDVVRRIVESEAAVDCRHRPISLVLAIVCVLPLVEPASAQGDPLALQRSAIQRIDAFVDQFRKTGDMRTRLPDLAQAEAELAASNRMLAARQDWSALALGLIKQGHTYRMQAQWPNAITLYQQAEDAAKRGRNIAHQADALAWRATAESSRRNVGQAFADAAQAVRLAENIDDKDLLARALDVLGAVQIAQRDLAGAADTLNRGVAVASEAKEPIAAYYAYLNRSEVYLKSGERCDFQRSFEPCYQALDRARADLQQASAIARKLGYFALARQTEQFIGTVETRHALIKSQEAMHQTVQKTALFRPKKPGDVLVTEKFVAPPGKIPPLLADSYEAMKHMEKRLGGFANVAEARTHFVEGMMNEMQGNNDAALAFFLKAVESLEGDRRALRDERSRGTFLEDRIGFYYAPIQQLLERRRYADAFELLERSRSRALADLIASRNLGLDRPEEQKLYAELTVLRTQIADAQSKLFELVSSSDPAGNRSQINALQSQIRALEAQHQKVVSRTAIESPRLQNLVSSTPTSLEALQQSMREERYEVLQYLVLEHGVIVWHIGPNAVSARKVFLPRTEVIGKVAALQKSLADRHVRFDETIARELFLFLVQPILAGIRSERLVIIPHEDLHYVPFQVFQDPADGRYLGERFQITYAPSASVLLGLKRSPGLSSGRLLAVADPNIPAANLEVQAIAKLFPGRSKIVVDERARESDVKRRKGDVKEWIRDFDVIHLAVHGKFDAGEPMLSYLLLARDAGSDGRLTAAEMFGLPLHESRLVVLSACETGRAKATHGNEILGMVRALMYAGAGSLVLSYWNVDSAATALWMQSFYEAALSRPLPEAARVALMKVKSKPEYSHPYFWAAFTTIGR